MLRERLDYRAYIAVESGNLAAVERELGNLDQAEALTRESLAMAFELESAYVIPYALADLGGLASERGSHEHGARLLGAADAAFARAGLVMDPGAEPTFRRDVERTREVLGERFESAWQGGRRLSTEDAVRATALVPPP